MSVHSQGSVRIGPGTLYDNLKRSMEQGWVHDLQPATENEKRLYRRTPAGKVALSAEIRRLDHLVRKTKRYLQGMSPRRWIDRLDFRKLYQQFVRLYPEAFRREARQAE